MAEKIYLATRDDVLSMGSQIAPIVKQEIDDCYDAIELKGGWVPETEEDKNLKNLPQAVESIQDRMSMFVSPDYDSEITIDSQRVREYAFDHMTISEFNAPNLTEIGIGVFQYCIFHNGLTEDTFNMPNVTSIPDSCFTGSNVLNKKLNLPKITRIGTASLKSVGLNEIILENCEYLGNNALESTGATTIEVPNVTYLGQTALGLNNMTSLRFEKPVNVQNLAFNSCKNLKTVTFAQTPIAFQGGGGTFGLQTPVESIIFENSGVDEIFLFTVLRNNLVTTCVITCQDGTIEYIGGSWQIVRD